MLLSFFFNDPAPTEIYTLSLHDALPISRAHPAGAYAPRGSLGWLADECHQAPPAGADRKSTRLNSSHVAISYAVFCLKKKKASEKPLLRITINQAVNFRQNGVTSPTVWS